MAYLKRGDIEAMGFASVADGVRISDRAVIHNPEQTTIGLFARIDDFAILSGKVNLGRNVHITNFCNLAGGKPGITMDDFSGLAYSCTIFSQSDDYSGESLTNPTVPAELGGRKLKLESFAPVHIGRHAILGAHCLVFPGANIGEGTAVAAGSIVTKPLEPWSIYRGAPAKYVRARTKKLLELEKYYSDWERALSSRA